MTRLPKIGMTDMEVRIDPQQAVDKLGASVKSCSFSTDAGTFNYDRDDPHAIFKYVRPRRKYWRNELVQTFFPGTYQGPAVPRRSAGGRRRPGRDAVGTAVLPGAGPEGAE